MIKLISLLLLTSMNALAFVHTKTEYNRSLKWEDKSSITVEIDSTVLGNTTAYITSSEAQSIISESINEWNTQGPIQIDPNYTNSINAGGLGNSIRFTNDPSYFGSGVLAVTSVNHSAATGEIYSADILINDSTNNYTKFSSNKSETNSLKAYLGDVISHELGHFFGLGHSEVFGSTMVYSVFKGQHSIHADDVHGVNSLYGLKVSTGSVSGKIVGGESIGVFGAQVQAISVKTGEVVTGVLSDTEGNFLIENLQTDDSYLIYVLPSRSVDNLPSYYASIQSKYCSSRDFVPSFFTKCGGRERGKPQAINLNDNNNIYIGNISIKCDEGLRSDYLYEKTKDVREEILIQEAYRDQNLSEVFLGYFSNYEVADTTGSSSDKLRIDLTSFTLPTADSYYLDIKVIAKEIGTGVKLSGNVELANSTIFDSYSYGSLGELNTDLSYQVPLSSNQTDNSFLLTLRADPATGFELNSIFGNSTSMTNSNNTYLVITTLKKITNGVLDFHSVKDSYPYEDNSYCLQGDITYTSKANVIGVNADDSSRAEKKDEQAQALSCGTIDIDDNDGQGGMMSFILGLSLIMLMDIFRRKTHDFFV
jgi:hypothetical protein